MHSERAGLRVMEGVSQFITKRLKLKVNESKSAVDRPSRRKFLGFSFTSNRQPRRRISPAALARFKEKIRELTSLTRGQSLRQLQTPLNLYLRGWRGYFGFSQTPSVLDALDSWIPRRLRCLAWYQWKNGRKRYAELRKRDVNDYLAARTANSPHGPWRISMSPALSFALPDSLWDRLGIERVFVKR